MDGRASAPGGWSVAQMFDHIVRVEVEILAAARRGVGRPRALGLRDKLGFAFLAFIFKSDRKVKVPKAAQGVLPGEQVEFSEVLHRWDATREDLRRFLEEFRSTPGKPAIFRHPVSGWMDVRRILGFFAVHMHHHEFQLRRLSKATETLPAA